MATCSRGARGAECNNFVTRVMAPGELFLEVLSSGVITQNEIDWVLAEKLKPTALQLILAEFSC